ncbi:MAG: deoxyribodipyrimidine photolyase [Crocinitomicaceae bacterium]|nr:deoxyribodipyrimidine photolyase [Crocinitomicaceae bacterium]
MKNIYNKLILKIQKFDAVRYVYSRNYIDGGVTRLSPYISRGIISTKTIYNHISNAGYEINQIQKFLQELCWRDYWQKKWQQTTNIDVDLKNIQSPTLYHNLPSSIVKHHTSIDAIDHSIEELYETGYMHNHLRMYTAGICCNIGQYHWLRPAKWMYFHLLDGDWGSNALSWQWVAGTNRNKKYIANQENINKYCHTKDKGTFLDKSYEELTKYNLVPKELQEEISLQYNYDLPKNELLKIDKLLPTFIYNSYNLDSNWKKEDNANRILLFEPSHFKKYPISNKVINFIIELSREIEGIIIAVMEFDDIMKIVKKESNIFFKEHPFNKHYKGNMEERDWIFPELEARGSFFSYWKKGIKTYSNR